MKIPINIKVPLTEININCIPVIWRWYKVGKRTHPIVIGCLANWLTGRFDPCSPKDFEYIQSFSKSKGLFFLGEIDMSYNNERSLSKEDLYEVYTKNIRYAK